MTEKLFTGTLNNIKNKTLLSVRSEHYFVFLGASFCTLCLISCTLIRISCTRSINPYTLSIIKCAGNLIFFALIKDH